MRDDADGGTQIDKVVDIACGVGGFDVDEAGPGRGVVGEVP